MLNCWITRLFLEFFSKRLSVKTSNVIVELVRLTVLWALWLSVGTSYYSLLGGPVLARRCNVDGPDRVPSPPDSHCLSDYYIFASTAA
jgi:hypothetical protein